MCMCICHSQSIQFYIWFVFRLAGQSHHYWMDLGVASSTPLVGSGVVLLVLLVVVAALFLFNLVALSSISRLSSSLYHTV